MIRCALCGAEWIRWKGIITHRDNNCALALQDFTQGQISAVNAAIEAAKADKRKPEECKHWTPESQNGYIVCHADGRGFSRKCCPCAAYSRKE